MISNALLELVGVSFGILLIIGLLVLITLKAIKEGKSLVGTPHEKISRKQKRLQRQAFKAQKQQALQDKRRAELKEQLAKLEKANDFQSNANDVHKAYKL